MKKSQKNVIGLCLIFMGLIVLCCCQGKKNIVDYGEDLEKDDRNIIEQKLDIPKSCQYDFQVENSNMRAIELQTEKIYVPDVDSMEKVYYKKQELTADYKKTVIEGIFEKDREIYVYHAENPYIDDVREYEKYYQECIEKAKMLGDNEAVEIYEEFYSDYVQMEDTASVVKESVGDYSANAYIGYIDKSDNRFLLTFSENENEFELSYYPKDLLIHYCPYKDDTFAAAWTFYGEEEEQELAGIDDMNQAELTKEEAQEEAETFLLKAGIENIEPIETASIEWSYYDLLWGSNGEQEIVYNGYCVSFSIASTDGITPYVADLSWNNTYVWENTEENPVMGRVCTVLVNDSGVFAATCSRAYIPTGKIEKNVELMTWKDILKTADTKIGIYYSTLKSEKENNGTVNQQISFNCVRLTYLMVQNMEDEGTYVYTPVWIFTQHEPDHLEYEYYVYPEEICIIDAVSGEIVHLSQVM